MLACEVEEMENTGNRKKKEAGEITGADTVSNIPVS
jgi:hypothetical protein